jgi:hypothetical protein
MANIAIAIWNGEERPSIYKRQENRRREHGILLGNLMCLKISTGKLI